MFKLLSFFILNFSTFLQQQNGATNTYLSNSFKTKIKDSLITQLAEVVEPPFGSQFLQRKQKAQISQTKGWVNERARESLNENVWLHCLKDTQKGLKDFEDTVTIGHGGRDAHMARVVKQWYVLGWLQLGVRLVIERRMVWMKAIRIRVSVDDGQIEVG